MYLIYLSSISEPNSKKETTLVKVDGITGFAESAENTKYYSYNSNDKDKCKLLALNTFLNEVRIDKNESVTIFLDSHELFFDWESYSSEEKDSVHTEEWNGISAKLLLFKHIPSIREKGILSHTLREEFKNSVYAKRNKRG